MLVYDGRIPAQLTIIQGLERSNQQLEGELANRLRLFFGTRVRPRLCELADTALGVMFYVGFQEDPNVGNQFLAHPNINFLGVVKTYGRNYGNLIRNIHNMTPSHYSDIIRMYGEWIEGKANATPFRVDQVSMAEEFGGVSPGSRARHAAGSRGLARDA